MTGKDIYLMAINHLGYAENLNAQQRVITIINKVYYDLHRIVNSTAEFIPIKSLADKVELPIKIIVSTMVFGVAESLALGEGDGELQQYFAAEYDRQKAKINTIDKVYDVFS